MWTTSDTGWIIPPTTQHTAPNGYSDQFDRSALRQFSYDYFLGIHLHHKNFVSANRCNLFEFCNRFVVPRDGQPPYDFSIRKFLEDVVIGIHMDTLTDFCHHAGSRETGGAENARSPVLAHRRAFPSRS